MSKSIQTLQPVEPIMKMSRTDRQYEDGFVDVFTIPSSCGGPGVPLHFNFVTCESVCEGTPIVEPGHISLSKLEYNSTRLYNQQTMVCYYCKEDYVFNFLHEEKHYTKMSLGKDGAPTMGHYMSCCLHCKEKLKAGAIIDNEVHKHFVENKHIYIPQGELEPVEPTPPFDYQEC